MLQQKFFGKKWVVGNNRSNAEKKFCTFLFTGLDFVKNNIYT
jgi:hypothetical protein